MLERFRKRSKRLLVGILGGLVVLLGLILVPYPGPGWLIVFGGLAILATEFESAGHVLTFAKGKYDSWVDWLKRQHWAIRSLVLVVTGAVVLITVWLLNAFGVVVQLLDLPYDWLVSPLFK